MNVRLTKEQKIKVLNSDDIYSVMQQVLLRENKIRRNQEHFWVVGLDNAHKILFVELVSLGSVNSTPVNPPEIFRMAIYKMAVKMILVHNHPSGELNPSESDMDTTDKMIKTGNLINIEVIDHLIISETGFFGFADKGLIRELSESGKYEIIDSKKAEMMKWHEELAQEAAIRDNNKVIAKKMKNERMDEKLIKKMTGLRLREIREL